MKFVILIFVLSAFVALAQGNDYYNSPPQTTPYRPQPEPQYPPPQYNIPPPNYNQGQQGYPNPGPNYNNGQQGYPNPGQNYYPSPPILPKPPTYEPEPKCSANCLRVCAKRDNQIKEYSSIAEYNRANEQIEKQCKLWVLQDSCGKDEPIKPIPPPYSDPCVKCEDKKIYVCGTTDGRDQRTFHNECEMRRANCLEKKNYRVLHTNQCGLKPYDPPKYDPKPYY